MVEMIPFHQGNMLPKVGQPSSMQPLVSATLCPPPRFALSPLLPGTVLPVGRQGWRGSRCCCGTGCRGLGRAIGHLSEASCLCLPGAPGQWSGSLLLWSRSSAPCSVLVPPIIRPTAGAFTAEMGVRKLLTSSKSQVCVENADYSSGDVCSRRCGFQYLLDSR